MTFYDGPPTLAGAFNVRDVENAFAANAHYQRLSQDERRALHKSLKRILSAYEMHKIFEDTPVPSSAARELENVVQSLGKVAEFGASLKFGTSKWPLRSLGASAIVDAADRWAASLPITVLPSQFHVTPFVYEGETILDFGSAGAIESFFEFADLVHRFTKSAIDELWRRERFQFSISAIQWLAGWELPALYTAVTNRKFTTTVSADGRRGSDGIQFVIDCLDALRLVGSSGGRFSPNTIKSHRKSATDSDKATRMKEAKK